MHNQSRPKINFYLTKLISKIKFYLTITTIDHTRNKLWQYDISDSKGRDKLHDDIV